MRNNDPNCIKQQELAKPLWHVSAYVDFTSPLLLALPPAQPPATQIIASNLLPSRISSTLGWICSSVMIKKKKQWMSYSYCSVQKLVIYCDIQLQILPRISSNDLRSSLGRWPSIFSHTKEIEQAHNSG